MWQATLIGVRAIGEEGTPAPLVNPERMRKRLRRPSKKIKAMDLDAMKKAAPNPKIQTPLPRSYARTRSPKR